MLLDSSHEVEALILDVVKEIFKNRSDETSALAAQIYQAKANAELLVCAFSPQSANLRVNRALYDQFNMMPDEPLEQLRSCIDAMIPKEELNVLQEQMHELEQGVKSYYYGTIHQQLKNRKYRFHVLTTCHDFRSESPTFICLAWLDKVMESELDISKSDWLGLHATASVYPFVWYTEQNRIMLSTVEAKAEKEISMHEFIERVHPEDVFKIKIGKSSFDSKELTFPEHNLNGVELRIDLLGHGYRWYDVRYRIVSHQGERLICGTMIDIEDRKVEAEKLKTKIAEVEAIEKRRSTLLLDLVQEVKTPLQTLLSVSELSGSKVTSDAMNSYLQVLRMNSTALQKALSNLEQMLGSESSREMAAKELVSIWEYMVEIQQIYNLKSGHNMRVLFTTPYKDIRLFVQKDILTRVFDTLFSLLIDQSVSGEVRLCFELQKSYLCISMSAPATSFIASDIAIEHTDPAADSQVKLAICRTMMGKIDGVLEEDSTHDTERVFRLKLPIQEQMLQATAVNADIVIEAPQEVAPEALPVILVAEDVLYNFMILKTLLEDRFHVVHAENGEQAVSLFKEHDPVFVFMDVKMPVMDGIEATRLIREMSQDVPVVILTAYAVRSLRKDAVEAGCTELLTKPTTAKQINATIRKYLKK